MQFLDIASWCVSCPGWDSSNLNPELTSLILPWSTGFFQATGEGEQETHFLIESPEIKIVNDEVACVTFLSARQHFKSLEKNGYYEKGNG